MWGKDGVLLLTLPDKWSECGLRRSIRKQCLRGHFLWRPKEKLSLCMASKRLQTFLEVKLSLSLKQNIPREFVYFIGIKRL